MDKFAGMRSGEYGLKEDSYTYSIYSTYDINTILKVPALGMVSFKVLND
jgi:hypothetical protein